MDPIIASSVSRARDALGSRGDTIGSPAGAVPPLELFHAPNSICSQKVRSVLAHHGMAYTAIP